MTAYYNEIDPFCIEWLHNLMEHGLIAKGDVDDRSIKDVTPNDLRGYTQCHFFAGIGVWSYALRQAGWEDTRQVWTGSCPCQPFSAAGKRNGFDDERHLWPDFFYLIEKCRPSIIFGEQVAGKDGLSWLDLVQSDLEGTNHAFAAADLCAAGVGSPQIRQRLWWVAYRMGYTEYDGPPAEREPRGASEESRVFQSKGPGPLVRLAYSDSAGREQRDWYDSPSRYGDTAASTSVYNRQTKPGATNGFWSNADWLRCTDEKWRPVESGTFPLVDGAASRVGRLRAYGNAIVPQVASLFISSVMEFVDGGSAS